MLPSNPVVVVGAALAIFAGGFGSGWLANGWRLNAEIADLKTEHAQGRAIAADAALADLAAAASTIKGAADEAQQIKLDLSGELGKISKELKIEIGKIPLPDGCKPDAGRVRALNAGIDAANKAAAR